MLLHAKIRGRVQGVGFRYWVVMQAQKLDLGGWVRNQPNGSVEVMAEGPEEALRDLEEILWRGPALSRVDEVDCDYLNEERHFGGFRVV